jgi:hypothetical protein
VTLDYVSIISDESSRIVGAYELDRRAAVPWSDRWTVATVARHVAATHHVVAEIVSGRPDADFGLFGQLQRRRRTLPSLSIGSAQARLRSSSNCRVSRPTTNVGRGSSPGVACWLVGSPHGIRSRRPPFGYRRGTRQGALGRIRRRRRRDRRIPRRLRRRVARCTHDAPAGPTVSFECSDRSDRWWLDLSGQGERIVSREPGDASVRIRGPAEQLLWIVWGRLPHPMLPAWRCPATSRNWIGGLNSFRPCVARYEHDG